MTNPRSAIKTRHEDKVLQVFLEALNRRSHASFAISERLEPPDAIIRSNRVTRWVEVLTVYLDQAWARDIWSYATPNEKHAPALAFTPGMDAAFAHTFRLEVEKKLTHDGYAEIASMYGGPGYLVVSLQMPFLSQSTIDAMRNEWKTIQDVGKPIFRSIYLVYPSMNQYRATRWSP